eukprot:4941779-Pyramimonas_sp.AAC.1
MLLHPWLRAVQASLRLPAVATGSWRPAVGDDELTHRRENPRPTDGPVRKRRDREGGDGCPELAVADASRVNAHGLNSQ